MTLKFLHLNINGYKSKKQDLKTLISEQKPDIVCLNETKLIKKENIKIKNYTSIMNNRVNRRTEKSYGGGTAILIREDIAYDQVRKFQIGKHEITSVTIYPDSLNIKKSFNLCCCYFPPAFAIDEEILKLLFIPNSIIVGDLNSKHPTWGSIKENDRGKKFRDTFDTNNIEKYMMPPNYKNKKGEYKEVIQQVLTSSTRFFQIENIKSLKNMGSDHLPFTFSFFDPFAPRKAKTVKLYHKLKEAAGEAILAN